MDKIPALMKSAIHTLFLLILVIGICSLYPNGSYAGANEFSKAPPLPKNSAPWIGEKFSGAPCIGERQGYGPYDYTRPDHRGASLRLVEGAHFMPRVNALVEDISDSTVINDIDYTIRAFPNHHQALYAVTRYWFLPDSQKRVPNNRIQIPPECYFVRAINFKPDDGTVRMLFGLYLHKSKKYNKALEQYEVAERLSPQSDQLLYNMGLLYFDMKQYEKSISYAKKAYAKQYPLPGLRNKLRKKGYWK